MKKIFTLLFAVGFLTAIHAQPGSRDNRDTRNRQQNDQWDNRARTDNDNRFDNNFGSYNGNIKMQIAQVNRKYDFKIQQVKHDRYMRRGEKMKVLRSLEVQRQHEIKMLYARSSKRGQYDRGYNSNNRY
jgi:hypothetical protein